MFGGKGIRADKKNFLLKLDITINVFYTSRRLNICNITTLRIYTSINQRTLRPNLNFTAYLFHLRL